MKEKAVYSTADLMKAFELGRNTLRLYEDMGLLFGMERTEAGYREYTKKHLEDLKFILDAKNVGFTLNEIKSLLDIVRSEQKITCGTVSAEISEKVGEINEQLKTLEAKKAFLQDFLGTCGSKKNDSTCDVMSAGFNKSACC
jgi:MerR family transcriptional regulator, Zn(II)-responsive regulator of zntA